MKKNNIEIDDRLKYGDKLMYMEGIVKAVDDASVEIELKGRLGKIKIPLRMFISDKKIKIGDEAGFMMSHPELLV